MKTYKSFDFTKMAAETIVNKHASRYFNSWVNVARWLDKKGFNAYEAQAILTSDLLQKAVLDFGKVHSKNADRHTSGHVSLYFDKVGITPRCKLLNEMVLKANPELKANKEGIPCREGTMPGNPAAGKTLVPVGTPLCCNPHSETYWSM